MNVEIATAYTDELQSALEHLVQQLSSTAPAPTPALINEILNSDATTLFIARHEERVVGSLTLAIFTIPTGIRAWIEDVVVDESARGLGCGSALTRAAVDYARSRGARSVDLTSRPSREAANRLYRTLGFEVRETNVFRLNLS